jgi:hypothetical protein
MEAQSAVLRAEKLVYEMDANLVVSMVGSLVGMKVARKGKWLVE